MKKWQIDLTRLVVVSLLIAGIALLVLWVSGCASKPPTALEQRYFTITTNYTPVIEVRTNVIPVTVIQTNVLMLTNVQGVVEYKTNVIPILSYQTNTVQVTNQSEAYTYSPNQTAKNVGEVGGAVGNLFGVGGLVTTAIGGLFSLWGWVRSSKKQATAVNLAQSIEGIREFIKALPNGASYDNALVQFLQKHQAETGTIQSVIQILENDVSSGDAKIAAQQIIAAIQALNPSAVPFPVQNPLSKV